MPKRKPRKLPEGKINRPFKFALDPTDAQKRLFMSHFGARRFAYNWTVSKLKEQSERYTAWKAYSYGYDWRVMNPPAKPDYPNPISLRAEWNSVKSEICVNAETGEPWWQENSKEAYSNAIFDACDGFNRWAKNVNTPNGRVGYPRYKRKGCDEDRYAIKTGTMELADRKHLKIPRVGVVRVHENMRSLDRLLAKGLAEIKSMTIKRAGHRIMVTVHTVACQPVTDPKPTNPDVKVGVDLGTRELAVVSDTEGNVLARVENPRAYQRVEAELARTRKAKERCTSTDSVLYRRRTERISRLENRAANIRRDHQHKFTTWLTKSHGRIVVEGVDWRGLHQQKGSPGAKTRRRDLRDAGLGEIRRQIIYKGGWYASEVIVADKFYPSSKTCAECGHVQNIGWAKKWTCGVCITIQDRDVTASFNLACYPESDFYAARCAGDKAALSPVGAAVKCGADVQPESDYVGTGQGQALKHEEGTPAPGGTGNLSKGTP